jgi:tetratricopeptide (TPR) repeat protein
MIDWFVGYSPPPEKYKAQVEQALKGIDTFQSLSAAHAKDPKNVEVAFKLAQKQEDLSRAKEAADLFRQIIALDPEGKSGATDYTPGRGRAPEKVSYTQYAEFSLGLAALMSRPPDRAPLQAFVKKYDGGMVKDAYNRLSSSYYLRQASKEEAGKFYEEWQTRFSQDLGPYQAWVMRIIQDKEPVDKGIDLAGSAIALAKAAPAPTQAGPVPPAANLYLSLAQLFVLKGDKAKAVETVEAAFKEAAGNDRLLPSIAQGYLDAGAEDKALAVYGPEFVRKNAASASMLPAYASFWARQGKNLDSALEAAKKATELDPKAFGAWLAVGEVYVKLKKAAEAVQAADKAVEVAPEMMKASVQRRADQIKSQAAEIK